MKLTKAQEKKIEKIMSKWWHMEKGGPSFTEKAYAVARSAYLAGVKDHKRNWVQNIIKKARARR